MKWWEREALPHNVYFITPIGGGPIKIGCSKIPTERLATYSLWSPVLLEIITTIPGDRYVEQALHGEFNAHRMHHEWFDSVPALMALIEQVKTLRTLPPRVLEIAHKLREMPYPTLQGRAEQRGPRKKLTPEQEAKRVEALRAAHVRRKERNKPLCTKTFSLVADNVRARA